MSDLSGIAFTRQRCAGAHARSGQSFPVLSVAYSPFTRRHVRPQPDRATPSRFQPRPRGPEGMYRTRLPNARHTLHPSGLATETLGHWLTVRTLTSSWAT